MHADIIQENTIHMSIPTYGKGRKNFTQSVYPSVLPCASLHPSHCNVLTSLTALAKWRYDRNTNDNEIQLRSYRVGISLLLSVQFSI